MNIWMTQKCTHQAHDNEDNLHIEDPSPFCLDSWSTLGGGKFHRWWELAYAWMYQFYSFNRTLTHRSNRKELLATEDEDGIHEDEQVLLKGASVDDSRTTMVCQTCVILLILVWWSRMGVLKYSTVHSKGQCILIFECIWTWMAIKSLHVRVLLMRFGQSKFSLDSCAIAFPCGVFVVDFVYFLAGWSVLHSWLRWLCSRLKSRTLPRGEFSQCLTFAFAKSPTHMHPQMAPNTSRWWWWLAWAM